MTLNLSEKDYEVMASQLHEVISTGDVQGYLESNINYEMDTDLDEEDDPVTSRMLAPELLFAMAGTAKSTSFIFNKFRRWLKRSRLVKKVRKAVCQVVNKIKELIDEEAELKTILKVIVPAVIAAIGVAASPVVITILIGFLATMILKGVTSVCPI